MRTAGSIVTVRSLDRAIRLLSIAALVIVVVLGGYYARDRFFHPNTPLVDRTLEQMIAKVQQDPTDLSARVALADAYLAKKFFDQAIAQYTEVLSKQEKHVGALMGLGVAYLNKGDTDQAIENLNKVVDLSKGADAASVDKRLQTAYYLLGRTYLQQGKLDQAAENLKSAIAIDRGDADAVFLLGNVFYAQGDFAEAAKAYRIAVAFVPDFTDAYKGMLQAYEELGDSAHAGYPRGMIDVLSGDHAKGVKELRATVAQVKDDAAFLALGSTLEEDGQLDQALDAYQNAVAANPDNTLAKDGVQRLDKK